MNPKIAIFPGSFDPITKGHLDIIQRIQPLFDQIIIAIGENSNKKYLFPLGKRKAMLESIFHTYSNIDIDSYTGLTIDFCRSKNAKYIIRGLRNSTDFEYEKTISQLNNTLNNEVDTIFVISAPKYAHIHSTIVREIFVHNGDISKLVPKEVISLI